MKRKFVTVGFIVMALVLMLGVGEHLSAGGGGQSSQTGGLTRLTMYPANARVPSGLMTGFRADVFAQQGLQMEVWTYSPERTNAILASGDLPDIMFIDINNYPHALDDMIASNVIMNLEPHLNRIPLLMEDPAKLAALNYTRMFRSGGTGQIYGIPTGIGVPTQGTETGRNAIRVNWDVYYEIGMPTVNNVWDLIPLMRRMVEARPFAADGTRTWGTVLNSGTDGVHWRSIEMWYKWHGYEMDNLQFLIESDFFNDRYYSILERDRNSLYFEGLRWYNAVFREGLLDPDSIVNDRMIQQAKVEGSRAVMVPAGTTPGWAGYRQIHIPGHNIVPEIWDSPTGRDIFIVVNRRTANLDAALTFINMMCDVDVFFYTWNGLESHGLWYTGSDGLIYMTDYAYNAQIASALHGEEFRMPNGEARVQWMEDFVGPRNYARTLRGPIAPLAGPNGERPPRGFGDWFEIREITDNAPDLLQWRERFGVQNFVELLMSHNAYRVMSNLYGVARYTDPPPPMMQLTLNAITDTIVTASWRMVYAENDAVFNSLWDQLMRDLRTLGAEEVIQWRLRELDRAAGIQRQIMGTR